MGGVEGAALVGQIFVHKSLIRQHFQARVRSQFGVAHHAPGTLSLQTCWIRRSRCGYHRADDEPGLDGSGGAVKDGIGLSNLRRRLNLLYGHDCDLRLENSGISGVQVSVALPYREA